MGLSREFLKGLELDKSTIDAIMSEYGSGVTEMKEQIAELKNENADLKNGNAELATLQKTHKELEQSFKALEKEKETLATQKAELETNSANNLKALKKDFAIKKAIMKSAPIDEVSYKAHLDLEKIEYDDEKDELKGFDDQDKAIRENYGFLFGSGGSQGGEHGGIDGGNGGSLTIEEAINQTM